MEVTSKLIKSKFAKEILERGIKYYKSGNVYETVKCENVLYAHVIGRAESPYSVEVNLKTLQSKCDCPYSSQCKHAVAALYYFINNPKDVVDGDKIITEIESMEKEEIVKMLKNLFLTNLSLFFEITTKNQLNSIKPLINSFRINLGKDFDFLRQQQAINQLTRSMENKVFKIEGNKKIDLILEFFEYIKQFFNDVDDSNGILGDLVYDCIIEIIKEIKKEDVGNKDRVVKKLLELEKKDEYGYLESITEILKENGLIKNVKK